MIAELLRETIFKYVHTLKPTNNGWYKCNCPVCHLQGHNQDKRQRFGIKFSVDGSFGINCFNCSFRCKWDVGHHLSKPLIWFLENISVPEEDIRELKFAAHREKEHVVPKNAPILSVVSKADWVKMDLPEGSKKIIELAEENCTDENFLKVAEYALSRKLPLNDLYWSPMIDNQFNKRLIIPFFYKNVIVGYTARYYATDKNKLIPKYYMQEPSNFVYNIDKQHEDRKYLIITEGAIDAMMVSGIACLGNKLNDTQISIINSLNKQVVLCPDRDNSGGNLIDVATANGWSVSFPSWEDDIKDPSDAVVRYGRLLTVKSILDSIVSNPLKIHVSRKFDNYKV